MKECNGIFGETRLSMLDVARAYGVHISTVHRWRVHGVRGVRLETFRQAGRRYSSREATRRFNQRVTDAADAHATKAQQPRIVPNNSAASGI